MLSNDQEGITKTETTTAQDNTVQYQSATTISHDGRSDSNFSLHHFPEIDGFQILEKLGEGGMGVVYRAHQERLQRTVAIKMIKSGNIHAEARERFKQETEAIARIKHPGIVQVFDVGEYQGNPYCILEYVAGGGLDQRTRQALPAPRIAARLVEQLADALSEVHRMKIVHRDLKPANILVQGEKDQPLESCQLKISDFGLAKFLGENESHLTQTGYALGTPNYMAPEQASGQAKYVTETADIYSIGAILYHLLTGQAPFRGSSVHETLRLVLEHDPIPPSRLQPGIPRDLEAICLRCLEKSQEKRYQTAHDLAADLRRFQAGEQTTARPLSGKERIWRWIIRHPLQSALAAAALLVLILTIAGAGITHLWLQADEARGIAVAAKNVEAEARSNLAQVKYFRQVDLAYRDWREGNVSQTRKLLADCEPSLRQWEWWHTANLCQNQSKSFNGHPTYVVGMSVTADGKRMLTSDEIGSVRYWDCETGALLHHFENLGGQLFSVMFLPGEKQFAVNSMLGKLLVFDIATRKCVQEVAEPGMGKLTMMAINNQGNMIAVGNQLGGIFVWVLEKTEKPIGPSIFVTIVPSSSVIYGLAFHPDGERLVATDLNRIRTYQVKSQKEVGSPIQSQSQIWKISFDPAGKYLAFGNETGQLEVIEFESRQRVLRTGAHLNRIWHALFHPKLPLIATGSMDQKIKVWDLSIAREVAMLRGHVDDVVRLQFDAQGDILYSIGDKQAKAWKWHEVSESKSTQLSGLSRQLLTLPSDESTCLTLLRSQLAKINGSTRSISLLGTRQPYSCLAEMADKSESLLVGRTDGKVEILSAKDARSLNSFQVSSKAIFQLAYVPSRQWILTLDQNNALQAWDLAKNQLIWKATVEKNKNPLLCCSDSGKWIATLGSDHQIALWNLETGQLLKQLKGHVNEITSLTTSPDGKSVLSTSIDISTRQWNVENGENTRTFIAQPNHILCAAYSPDGQRVATGSLDNTIKIWDVLSGAEVMTLHGHSNAVTELVFAKDGQGLYSSGRDRTLRYWPASKKIPLPETVQYDLNPPK